MSEHPMRYLITWQYEESNWSDESDDITEARSIFSEQSRCGALNVQIYDRETNSVIE